MPALLRSPAQDLGDQVLIWDLLGAALAPGSQPSSLSNHLGSHRTEQLDRLRPSCQVSAVLTRCPHCHWTEAGGYLPGVRKPGRAELPKRELPRRQRASLDLVLVLSPARLWWQPGLGHPLEKAGGRKHQGQAVGIWLGALGAHLTPGQRTVTGVRTQDEEQVGRDLRRETMGSPLPHPQRVVSHRSPVPGVWIEGHAWM